MFAFVYGDKIHYKRQFADELFAKFRSVIKKISKFQEEYPQIND